MLCDASHAAYVNIGCHFTNVNVVMFFRKLLIDARPQPVHLVFFLLWVSRATQTWGVLECHTCMQRVTVASTKWSDYAGERELHEVVMSNARLNYRAILRARFSVFFHVTSALKLYGCITCALRARRSPLILD